MRNVYLVLILCCLVGCNHKTEEGKSLMVTHESIQLKNDYLGKPGPIIELDKKIVGIDYALDSCLFYIDIETDSLYRFGPRGVGPDEFIYPHTIQHLDKNRFGIFDLQARKYTQIQIKNHQIHMETPIAVANDKISMSFDVKQISDNSYLGMGPYPKEMFVFMDSLSNTKSSFSEFPYKDSSEKALKNHLRAMAYQGRLVLNTDRDRVAFTSIWGEIFHIYKVEKDSLVLLNKSEKVYPKYTVEDSQDGYSAPMYGSNIVGYISSTANNQYIYLLYSGTNLEDYAKAQKEFDASTIHVFNWEGEKVQTLTLDIPCTNICISSDSQVLWAITNNPDPELVKFNLPTIEK